MGGGGVGIGAGKCGWVVAVSVMRGAALFFCWGRECCGYSVYCKKNNKHKHIRFLQKKTLNLYHKKYKHTPKIIEK